MLNEVKIVFGMCLGCDIHHMFYILYWFKNVLIVFSSFSKKGGAAATVYFWHRRRGGRGRGDKAKAVRQGSAVLLREALKAVISRLCLERE